MASDDTLVGALRRSLGVKRPRRSAASEPAPAQESREGGEGCPEGLLPDGERCPRCGGPRAPSGIGGGTWVHFPRPAPAAAPASERCSACGSPRKDQRNLVKWDFMSGSEGLCTAPWHDTSTAPASEVVTYCPDCMSEDRATR